MAIYHLSVRHASRAKGSSARWQASYLSGDDLVHTESGNMPEWACGNALVFWQAADRYERANGRLSTKIDVALPRELTLDQRLDLMRDFVARHLGERHPYTLALRNSRGLDGFEQPHAHLQFSERALDGRERDPRQFFKQSNHRHPELGGTPKVAQ